MTHAPSDHAAPSRSGLPHRRWTAAVLVLAAVLWGVAAPGPVPADAATADAPVFASQPARPTVYGARSTVPVDLDGDGDIDLATAADDPRHGIYWHRNEDGAGQDWTLHSVDAGAASMGEVVAADLDGDGDMDLASISAETVRWHRNGDSAGGGDGSDWTTFVVADSDVPVGGLVVADFDGDGDSDLAAAIDDTVRWYRNGDAAGGGDGSSWTTTVVATDLEYAVSVVAADLDGDGDTDLATVESIPSEFSGAERVSWYRNGDTGGGGNGMTWTAITVDGDAPYMNSLVADDIDGDGDVDLASMTGGLIWFRNDGADGWTTVDTGVGYGAAMATADVDGDGDIDMITGKDTHSTLLWIRNGDSNGAGDGTAWTAMPLEPHLLDVTNVVAADVDGDGDTDLITASRYDKTVAWHDNRDGLGATWARVDVVVSDDNPLDVQNADIDGDGDLDLVTASEYDDDTIAWNRNGDGGGDGDGTDWTRVIIAEQFKGAADVAIGDIDGDGDLDVAAVAFDGLVAWFRNGDGTGGGDGTSWTRIDIAAEDERLEYVNVVTLADIDGDGDLDLATAAAGSRAGILWHRNGDGAGGGDGTSWTTIEPWQSTDPEERTGVSNVAAADVDGDGDIDLLGSATYESRLFWHRNDDGDGQAWTRIEIEVPFDYGIGLHTTMDVDADGDVDVVAGVDSALVVLRNGDTSGGGDGTAWTPTEVAARAATTSVVADFDGDGDDDLASGSNTGLAWHRNEDGVGGSWSTHAVHPRANISALDAGDVDGDGDIDFTSTSYYGVTPWVHTAVDAGTDDTGPELLDLTILGPTTVDSSQGPRSIGIRLRIADAAARFATGALELTSPSGTTIMDGRYKDWGFSVVDRIAGDATDGVHQTTVLLPTGSENGTWRISRVELTDHAGNTTVFASAQELAAAGHDTDVEVAFLPDDTDGGGSTDDGGGSTGDGGSTDDGSGSTSDDGSTDSGGATGGGSTDGTTDDDGSTDGEGGGSTGGDATTGGADDPTPAPSFVDDDDSAFEADIEWIAAAGITKGCNPPINDRFCPDDPVTRGQMAAFLTRALGLTSSSVDWFGDDGDSIFEADINALARAGITAGCNPPDNDRYCPAAPVTRQEMAAFLSRGRNLPDAAEQFTDVSSDSVFAPSIGALAAADITRGCNPPTNDRFCPTEVVTRGQMAAFLARALRL